MNSQISPEKKTLLHVGPSFFRIENTTAGFNDGAWTELRYDIDESVKPDVIGTMIDMSALANESVDAVYSAHNLEHLYPHEVAIALSEFLRVLKPDGFVVLTCPDLKSIAQLVAQDKLDEPAYLSPAGPISPIDMLYGLRSSIAKGNHYMAHRCGFTGKTLMSAFLNAGFKKVIATHRDAPAFDLWIVGTKHAPADEQLSALAAAHFPK
jgi:SAM-dependent methyltransferase